MYLSLYIAMLVQVRLVQNTQITIDYIRLYNSAKTLDVCKQTTYTHYDEVREKKDTCHNNFNFKMKKVDLERWHN